MSRLKSDSYEPDEIEITPEMIEAGVNALSDSCDSSLSFQAKSVFESMIKASSGLWTVR